jgi:prophage regulatory protein
MPEQLNPHDLILRSERKKLVPLSDTTIWRMERRGEFPRRIVISSKRVAWRRSEIDVWLRQRATISAQGAA